MTIDRSDVLRVLDANRYLVLGTADEQGRPWVTPVFFAPLADDGLCWVSAPTSRHSHNLTARPAVAITVFDSTVAVGRAEAAYFDAEATVASAPEQSAAVLAALNGRLPADKRLAESDLQPLGPLVAYRAQLHRWYLLVRGGGGDFGNDLDQTVEV